MITATLILLLFSIVCIWMWRRKQKFQVLQKMGISGPKPSFLFGNSVQLMTESVQRFLARCEEQYGDVVGLYYGVQPVIATSNPDIIQEVLVKQFDKFTDRNSGITTSHATKFTSILHANGDVWRRIRRVTTPGFTGKRLNEMKPLFKERIDSLVEYMKVKSHEGNAIDIYKQMKEVTLEVIAATAFGLDIDCIKEPDNAFLKTHSTLFNFFTAPTKSTICLSVLFKVFPDLLFCWRQFVNPQFFTINHGFYHDVAEKMIEQRRMHPVKRPDLLALLIKSMDSDAKDNLDKSLNIHEAKELCYTLLIAGVDTTAAMLSFVTYDLALHPEVQDRLRDDINAHFPEKGMDVDYDTLKDVEYLDMVVHESMRLHSFGELIQTRKCTEATTIKGISVPRGMVFQINARQLHRSRDLWGDDVDEFNPERWSQHNKQHRHPMAFMVFGQGPRGCLGLRFALLEIKLMIVGLLQNFDVVRAPETKAPLPVSLQLSTPSEGVYVRLQRRP